MRYEKTCWRAPLDGLSFPIYIRAQIGHFFITMFGSWLVIFSSLMIGAMFGELTGVLPPLIGLYAIVAGLAHVLPLYAVFNIRTWKYYDIRVNPYVSLVEWLFHEQIGFYVFVTEVGAQALGATIASASVYGLLKSAPLFLVGVGTQIQYIDSWWLFFLEFFSGTFIGWVYFHNWYHDGSENLPITMAYVVSIGTIICFPFIGATTHNPFRYLSSCIIEQSCSQNGWWAFTLGPGAGIVFGYLVHLVTWKLVRIEKNEEIKIY